MYIIIYISSDYRKVFKMKHGFTLAEVLITLAIIGIVAILTIPNLLHQYKKTEIETKLKRFYSMANQAIQLSEIENGPKESWDFEAECSTGYEESCIRGFWDKYLEKYFKYNKAEFVPREDLGENENGDILGGLRVYLADGSCFHIGYSGQDYVYYINCGQEPEMGKNAFMFAFYPNMRLKLYTNEYVYYKKGIVPYVQASSDTITLEGLYSNTLNYTKIIELNGWKIPDDYPVKL